jgi:hypothetical protein
MSNNQLNSDQCSVLTDVTPVESNDNIVSKATIPSQFLDVTTDTNDKKDYIVIVKEEFTIDKLEEDLERDTSNDNTVNSNIIPDRAVEVANRRPGSERQTHYWLTDEEAIKLKNHPMVHDVEWNPVVNPFVDITLHSSINQNFERAGVFGSSAGDRVNFGLYRCSTSTNAYGIAISKQADYNYVLDGSGVDVVIMDDGVLRDHPEWQDSTGTSRLQIINWYSVAGISGTMPAGFYTQPGGHATHVAGIVAGKTFGWAKNAKIYSMNILGKDPIDVPTAFDLIKLFHRNKSIDPNTGQKRPTIVNASWGVTKTIISTGGTYDPYIGHTIYTGYQIWGGNYRGKSWTGFVMHPNDYALTGTKTGTQLNSAGNVSELYQMNGKSTAYDALVQDLINEGVHFIHAAGNNGIKSDKISGSDYNNFVNIIEGVTNGIPILSQFYYNRTSSPHATDAINVGSIDGIPYTSVLERRAYWSSYGGGVDLYAPGGGIVSSYDSTSGSPYFYNSNYYQYNDSGTSMASPQVAGVLALFLQLAPGISPAQAKKWILNNSVSGALFDTGLTNDYSTTYSLSGGSNKFLYNPYAIASINLINSGTKIQNGVLKLKS